MKKIQLNSTLQKPLMAVCLFFFSNLAHAQIDVDIDLGKSEWYEDPKVWIGVAVFLLILAFIVRSRK